MNPAVRIAGCRLIEKMNRDPAFSAKLSLQNVSRFRPDLNQLRSPNERDGQTNTKQTDIRREKK